MPKAPSIISASLPNYEKDRQEWRRKILIKVRQAAATRGIRYKDNQLFDVEVVLYMKGAKRLAINDVDNRLKDILDALQGRFRGSWGKKQRLIKNDNKICRAVIEKTGTPKKFKNSEESPGGKIVIRPYKRKWK